MGIAVADGGEAVSVGEADDPVVPRPSEGRRVERLQAVGVDAPQQLLDDTAPPIELANLPPTVPVPTSAPAVAGADLGQSGLAAPAMATGAGLSPVQHQSELAAVPDPQRPLAAPDL